MAIWLILRYKNLKINAGYDIFLLPARAQPDNNPP